MRLVSCVASHHTEPNRTEMENGLMCNLSQWERKYHQFCMGKSKIHILFYLTPALLSASPMPSVTSLGRLGASYRIRRQCSNEERDSREEEKKIVHEKRRKYANWKDIEWSGWRQPPLSILVCDSGGRRFTVFMRMLACFSSVMCLCTFTHLCMLLRFLSIFSAIILSVRLQHLFLHTYTHTLRGITRSAFVGYSVAFLNPHTFAQHPQGACVNFFFFFSISLRIWRIIINRTTFSAVRHWLPAERLYGSLDGKNYFLHIISPRFGSIKYEGWSGRDSVESMLHLATFTVIRPYLHIRLARTKPF